MSKCLIQVSAIAFFLLFLTACSDEGGSSTEITDIITPGSILDVGNTNTASDALVTFSLSDIRLADEVTLVVFLSSDFSNANNVQLESIPQAAKQTIVANRLTNKVKLSSSLTANNGQAIVNDVDYTLIFITTLEGVSQVNSATKTFQLSDRNVLEGRYTGLWNDNIYTNFGISAELEAGFGNVSGPFFYSESFSSCCGGENDGTIRLSLEGDQILAFTYSQSLESFMGGPCPGLYTGAGFIKNDNEGITLVIDFEGDDCEGSHTDGKIELNRIE